MGKKGGAPKPPDPMQTAQAQTSMNIGTAIAQQMMGGGNQITPYGNLTRTQTGTAKWTDPLSGSTYEIPQYTTTQTLSPAQQKLLDSQTQAGTTMSNLANQQLGKLGGILGSTVDVSKAPKVNAPQFDTLGGGPKLSDEFGNAGPITRSYGDDAGYAQQRQRVENALMQRMNPGLQQDRSALMARLANQGIKVGTEAYDRELRNYDKGVNDARLGAILGAGEEQTRLAGLDQARAQFQNSAQQQAYSQLLGRAQFGNEARQQMFGNRMASSGFNNQQAQQAFSNQQALRSSYLNERYAARNQPINEIAALLGGGQVQNPNFVNTASPGVANTDYAGMVGQNYNQQLAAWQQRQQNNPLNGILGGLFGLGSSAIMASDRRLKTDVSFLGWLRDLPIYAYRYVWGGPMRVGVMAQDMLELRPAAVVRRPDGFLAVDYGRL